MLRQPLLLFVNPQRFADNLTKMFGFTNKVNSQKNFKKNIRLYNKIK
jgi:hypothetical protein